MVLGHVMNATSSKQTTHQTCADLIMGHRLRRWPNIKWAHSRCLAVPWYPSKHKTFTKCCCNVGPPSTTMAQHYSNIWWVNIPGITTRPVCQRGMDTADRWCITWPALPHPSTGKFIRETAWSETERGTPALRRCRRLAGFNENWDKGASSERWETIAFCDMSSAFRTGALSTLALVASISHYLQHKMFIENLYVSLLMYGVVWRTESEIQGKNTLHQFNWL